VHVGKAREAGATVDEISEVVMVVRAAMQTRLKDTREYAEKMLAPETVS
jgi:alkylhydroperoxidase/carboxymuconolactone decarboxylase family protein YurZ